MISFENDFQHKVMHQQFDAGFDLANQTAINEWKTHWLGQLKNWHSPYKLVIDCSNLHITQEDSIKSKLDIMFKFFKGLHLRSVIGYGYSKQAGHDYLPFEVVNDFSEAKTKISWREKTRSTLAEDFRAQIRLENHLKDQIVELSFESEVTLDTKDQVNTIKSKIMNNLMQWHSPWNLLIDCFKLNISEQVAEDFHTMITSFKGLHLRQVLGYQPNPSSKLLTFKVFRSRHKAVANLESDPSYKADLANCSTRKSPPPIKNK